MRPQIVSHPLGAAGLVVEGAVQLGLERGIKGPLELRPGLVAQGDDVAAKDDGLGRGVFQDEALGGGAELVEPPDGFGGNQRRPAQVVRLHHGQQFIEGGGGNLAREAADRLFPVDGGDRAAAALARFLITAPVPVLS